MRPDEEKTIDELKKALEISEKEVIELKIKLKACRENRFSGDELIFGEFRKEHRFKKAYVQDDLYSYLDLSIGAITSFSEILAQHPDEGCRSVSSVLEVIGQELRLKSERTFDYIYKTIGRLTFEMKIDNDEIVGMCIESAIENHPNS